ncbi:MAG: adenosylcobinamide-phosphate synthase CbiB [Xanthobacteraceae bacterium]|jgi:adenosylcobinamide-phosphate synthase
MPVELAFCALLIEALVGYPDRVARAIGHPVVWIGALIGILDREFNRASMSEAARRTAGGAAILVIVAISAGVAYALQRTLLLLPLGFILLAIVASTLLAQRSLYAHVARVARALEAQDIAAAREAVSHIVGRDPVQLDAAGVARAAIESLAENFSDGVVAPAFWLAVAGLPGGAAYKAINTADSMLGHRTARHEAFGAASARVDDLVNLPASRLSALLIIAAAAFTSGASATRAWRAVWRDARHHRSPNAGYPEAAVAGALDLALAGPRVYGGMRVEDAIMGDGRRDANAADIRAALSLYIRADALLIALLGLPAVLA